MLPTKTHYKQLSTTINKPNNHTPSKPNRDRASISSLSPRRAVHLTSGSSHRNSAAKIEDKKYVQSISNDNPKARSSLSAGKPKLLNEDFKGYL